MRTPATKPRPAQQSGAMLPGDAYAGIAPPADPHADIALAALRPVVHAIATSFGRRCEVVLHDLRHPEAAVIEIAGHLSERSVGAPVNEISQWLLARGKDVPEKTNELIRTPRGRTLKSTTILLRRPDGSAFGALCINIDVTELGSVARLLTEMVGLDEAWSEPPKVIDDIGRVVQTVIAAEEATLGATLDIAVQTDRVRIFRALERSGVFTLKQAVPRLAEYFGLSRATIYSYLGKLHETEA
jgi:predicted transcriptional regulator YheO